MNVYLFLLAAAVCLQCVTSQNPACPTVKTTIMEHEDKITRLEIKVQQIHKTCSRRREIIDVTTDLVGKVRGHLLNLRTKLVDSKQAAQGEQAGAFDKWIAVVDSLISQFTFMRPDAEMGGREVETCITTVTEVTQRITKLRHKLRELVVIQSCDQVSTYLREVVNEYQRIETVVRRFTDITATRNKPAPSRGRSADSNTYNTGGAPLFFGNQASIINYGTISNSQFELFGSNSISGASG